VDNREGIQGPAPSHGHGGFVGPTILIGIGILLLLSNLGMLQWSVWETIGRLWPILLIAAGLDTLVGRRSAVGSLLSALIVLALIAGGVWLIAAPAGTLAFAPGREFSGQDVSQSLDGARLAEISIRPGRHGGSSAWREGHQRHPIGERRALLLCV
jgi:hypothetical protein